MSDTVWGVLFTAYLLAALPIMGMGNGDIPKPRGLEGSSRAEQWEARDRRWKTLGLAWIVGLVALCIVWAYS